MYKSPRPCGSTRFPRTALSLLLATGAACLMGPTASAIQPQRFQHATEADFEPGEVDGTLVTSLGDVKLATESKTVGEMPEEASVIYDLYQMPDGTIYLAAGPQGKLFKQDGDDVVEVADLPDEQVFALGEYDGKLLIAISGESSRLALLEDGELTTLTELEGVRYIWDILIPPTEMFHGPTILAATGTEGKLLRIKPDDEAPVTELMDAQQANILCLAMDNQGRIIAGTDEDGLVLRLEAGEEDGYQAFAMFDAPEPEIGALLVASDGSVYVGTADAEQARPGRLEEAASEEAGRPDDDANESDDTPAPEEAPGDPEEIPGVEPEPEPLDDASEPVEPQTESQTDNTDNDAAEQSDTTASDQTELAQADAEPTPEQYDRLRELIRDRLSQARKSGEMQAGSGLGGSVKSSSSGSRSRPVSAPAVEKEGNAVYHIDSQGFVHEVFRDSVMILKLVEADGKLLAATGNEGQVFVIDPATRENAVLVDLGSEQVPAMLLTKDGSTVLGSANPAELFTLGSSYAHRGVYTSPTLDAAQISLWGAMSLTADIPEGCSLTVETRSGNVQDPEQAAWSTWSSAQSLMPDTKLPALAPKEIAVQAPPARFLQYRLTLTGTDDLTPVVDRVDAAYVTPNLKPVITKVTAAYPEEEAEPDAPPATIMNIEWEAADDNLDPLVYKLDYQPAGSDSALLIAEDLTEMTYEWETRRVPDGRYTVRVTADDRPDNPGDMAMTATRRASPVLVDNSPPDLTIEKSVTDRKIMVSGQAKDDWSTIRSLAYTLDSDDEYHPILPSDLIFDSTQESWDVTIPDLSPGPHVLTLRAADTRGNTVYQSVIFQIK